MAKDLRNNEEIVFAEIDGTKNEMEGLVSVEGFPEILLYLKDRSYAPIKYEGELKVNELKDFLRSHLESDYIEGAEDLDL